MNRVRVGVLIEHDCWAGMAMLVKEAYAIAGTLHARDPDLQRTRLFDVRLVARTLAPVRSFTGPMLAPETSIADFVRPEVIIVAPQFFATHRPPALQADVKAWLLDAYEAGAILLTMASGVRTLAETGLLDGHEVTGNPSDREAFAAAYPRVRFSPETPLIIDGRILSASTIDPCLDALAWLIARFHGEAPAHKFTRYTNPHAQPPSLGHEADLAPFKRHEDERVRQAQEFIERHSAQDIGVSDVARRVAMSERNFLRRFQQAVGMGPLHYLQRCRVERAKRLLDQSGLSVLQAALQSGFTDALHLRRSFRKWTGMTPQAWRERQSPGRTIRNGQPD